MTDHNCLFQVSLFKGEHHLLSFDWTGDKDAVIEFMDEVNHRKCRDLQFTVIEHDYHRGVFVVAKNGYALVETEPFLMKPFDEKVKEAAALISTGNKTLRAGVTTRGNGGITINQDVLIGGAHEQK